MTRGGGIAAAPEESLTPLGLYTILMRAMKFRRAIVLLVLGALVGLPPVAMSSDGCVSMDQMCEAPCGATVCAVFASPDSVAPDLVERVEMQVPARSPASPDASLEPPPKLSLLSA